MADAVVDASVWVSRFVAHDVHHPACARWIHTALTEGTFLVSPMLLLAEVAGPIARRTGHGRLGKAAVRQLLRVDRLRLVAVDRMMGDDAATFAAALTLRGADAVYVAVAARLGLPLVTVDRELRDRARGAVSVIQP